MKKVLLIITIFSANDWATAHDGKILVADCDRDSQELADNLNKYFNAEVDVLFYDSDDRAKHDARITIDGSTYDADVKWAEKI